MGKFGMVQKFGLEELVFGGRAKTIQTMALLI